MVAWVSVCMYGCDRLLFNIALVMFFGYIIQSLFGCCCLCSAIIGRNMELFKKHLVKFVYAMPAVGSS